MRENKFKFQGIVRLQAKQKVHANKNHQKNTKLSENVRKILKNRMKNEYVLYNYIKSELLDQFNACINLWYVVWHLTNLLSIFRKQWQYILKATEIKTFINQSIGPTIYQEVYTQTLFWNFPPQTHFFIELFCRAG